MGKAFRYFAISITAAAVFIAQPALGQQVSDIEGKGPKRVLVECDISGKRCQVVGRLRSPATCQTARVSASLQYIASRFFCARE